MATISSIVVQLKANNSKFNKETKASVAQLSKFAPAVKAAERANYKLGTSVKVVNEDINRMSKTLKRVAAAAKRAASRMKKFAKVAAIAGAAIAAVAFTAAVGIFSKLTRGIIETADALDKTSKTASKLGTSLKGLQFLQFIATQSGVSIEQLNTGLQRQVRRVAEAASGYGAAKNALSELRLNAEQLNKLPVDEQFLRIAKALNGVASQGDKVRLTMQIFDTEGVGLINAFGANVEQLRGQFNKFNIELTKSQQASVAAFTDASDRLDRLWGGFYVQLTANTSNAFTALIEWIEKTVMRMGGVGEAAKIATSFMISGLTGVINVAEGVVNAIDLIGDAIESVASGNAINKLGLALGVAAEKALEGAAAITGGEASVFGRGINQLHEIQQKANTRSASLIVANEKDIAKRLKGRKKLFDDIRAAANSAREAITGKTTSDVEPSAPRAVTNTKSLASIKAEEKAAKKAARERERAAKKRNSQTEIWKRKLKSANDRLKEQTELMKAVKKEAKEINKATNFADGISALSDLAARASDPNATSGEINAQRKILSLAKKRFEVISNSAKQRPKSILDEPIESTQPKPKEPVNLRAVDKVKEVTASLAEQKEAVDKVKEAEKEKAKQAAKYKEQLAAANEQLKAQKKLLDEIKKKQKRGKGLDTSDFGGSISALSRIAAKANDPNATSFERNAQNAILRKATSRFNNAPSQSEKPTLDITGKIEIEVATDEKGNTSSSVKKAKFKDAVGKVVIETLNKQARANDR